MRSGINRYLLMLTYNQGYFEEMLCRTTEPTSDNKTHRTNLQNEVPRIVKHVSNSYAIVSWEYIKSFYCSGIRRLRSRSRWGSNWDRYDFQTMVILPQPVFFSPCVPQLGRSAIRNLHVHQSTQICTAFLSIVPVKNFSRGSYVLNGRNILYNEAYVQSITTAFRHYVFIKRSNWLHEHTTILQKHNQLKITRPSIHLFSQ